MSDTILFASTNLYAVLQRLYLFIEAVCSQVGDVSLAEYATLVDVAEARQERTIVALKESFSFLWGGFDHYLALLEEKELVERRRSTVDRRTFCVRETIKGRERILSIDRGIGYTIVGSTPRVTEIRFEQLVQQLHDVNALFDSNRGQVSMFPAYPLRALCHYRQILVGECAIADLSALQFALLCSLDGMYAQDWSSNSQFEQWERVRSRSLATPAAFAALEEKRLVRRAEEVSITEAGKQRRNLIAERLQDKISLALAKFTEEQEEGVARAVESLLYLLG